MFKWLIRIGIVAYIIVAGLWIYQWMTGMDALGLILEKLW